jgi:glycosyltransferase involved in cell wall biosynthesis
MKKLSILLSTINDRIYAAESILLQNFEDTEFIVVHQITDYDTADNYQSFYAKFDSEKTKFIPRFEKGTGRSRNCAMENASGKLFYLCDDDLIFKKDFYSKIMQASEQFPSADIFTFKIETTENQPYKNYPSNSFTHTIRSCATVSIVEMVIRRSAFQKGLVKFDERFGLGTKYNTGEEFVMLSDGLKKGLIAVYVPEYLIQHPPVSSGKIFNKEVAFDKGAMIAKVYGWKFLIIDGLFALRKYNEYKSSLGFLSFIYHIYKGSFKFLRNG